MARIIGISGSLRRESFNTSLLRAAAGSVPAGSSIEIASIREIPVYDGDVESTQGIPPSVQALKDQIAGGDGLLIVTPEYNNSMPGVLKNAIDWLSRPPADSARVFRGRPVAITGATPGLGGTRLSQAALLPVLRTLGTMPWFEGRLEVSSAAKVFDKDGRIVDDAIRARLETFVKDLWNSSRALRRHDGSDDRLRFGGRLDVIGVDELLELGVQEVGAEAVLLHFLERLISVPAVVRDPIRGGHDARAVTAARAVHVHRLIRRIVDQLEKRRQLIARRHHARVHRDPEELHSRAAHKRGFTEIAVLLEIDHCLHAKLRQAREVASLRLSATVVVRVEASEVVDANA
jgi:NAD(P)H-dependent FMN reductase